MKENSVYLRHILECIRRIEEDTACGRDRFMESHTYQDAVLRNLQTMAESTQRLSEDIKAAHPDIEWQSIAAFRNVLVHNYLGIDIERIWEIVQKDVPALKRRVQKLLDAISTTMGEKKKANHLNSSNVQPDTPTDAKRTKGSDVRPDQITDAKRRKGSSIRPNVITED